MADISLGDITLNGLPYKVDIQSWGGKDVIDFAPRATVPGGAFVMSDLGMFQPLLQTDWRHGFGHHWYSDSMGYMSTEGNIDTRQDGLAMMFTQATESASAIAITKGIVVFNDQVYKYGAAGLHKLSGSSWTAIYTTAAVNAVMPAGAYLFFAPNGLRVKKMTTADVVSDAGLDANATDYRWLILHNGYVYAGKDGTNAIHFDNSPTLATLQGNSSDTNRILAGVGDNPILGAIVYNGNLYVRKADGVWAVGEDRIARRMLDFAAEESPNNLRSWAVINGYLVMPMRDRVLQWNGARVTDITPKKVNDSFPYTTYGRFDNFVAVGDFLYCTAQTNETTYDVALLVFDGVGWHKLATLLTDVTSSYAEMLSYEAVNNRLWYHIDTATDKLNYFQFQNYSTFPYADFPTTGTHSLISSRIDVGFRRVQKSFDKIYVEARNCTSTTYLKMYYSLDGGTWIYWRDIKENGIIECINPGGELSREFNYMQIRFDFVTGTTSQSPILEGWSLSFIMRPVTRMGYNFNVMATSNYQHGMHIDDRSAAEILAEIMDMRNSAAPVTMTDIYGNEHVGYLTSVREKPIYRKTDGDGDVEVVFSCNFVEI